MFTVGGEVTAGGDFPVPARAGLFGELFPPGRDVPAWAGLLVWAHDIGARPSSPSAREGHNDRLQRLSQIHLRRRPAVSKPVVRNGSTARAPHSARRPRTRLQDRDHAGAPTAATGPTWRHSGARRCLAVLHLSGARRAPASAAPAVNGALHRLEAGGQITLEPGARGTRVRVLCASRGPDDILGSPAPSTETPAEGGQFGSSAPA